MIERLRRKNEMYLVCDGCEGNFHHYAQEDFYDMINEAKDDGWLIIMDGSGSDKSGWSHYCPDCRPEYS